MAKIKGPLFSVKGSGKLSKSIIYGENKGIKTAKKYEVPLNPNSDDQKDQRGFMTNSVLAWKTDGYNVLDIEAWNLYAKIQKGFLSGYNMFLKERINKTKIGIPWFPLWNCVIEDPGHASCTAYINCDVNRLGRLYSGKTKSSMLQETVGVFDGTKYKFPIAGLEQNTRYYFYIKNIEDTPSVRTGIYSFKTIKYTAPTLTIGNDAVDRFDEVGGELTLVDRFNPANEDGIIKKIEMYCPDSMFDIKVASFFIVSGNNLSTRDYVEIANVPSGYSVTDIELEVKEGDLIGIWPGARNLKADESGIGLLLGTEDFIPCINQEFIPYDNYTISLHGTG